MTHTYCPMSHEVKTFSSKFCKKWDSKLIFKPFFFFSFFKIFIRKKQMVCSIVSIHLVRPQLGMQRKQTTQNFRLLIQRHTEFWFSRKTVGNSFSTAFYVWFFTKNLLMIYSFNWQKFHCHVAFLLEILNKMCIAIV